MPTYPLAFPAVGVQRSTFRLKRIVSSSESPFTGEQQHYPFPGEWWEGEIVFRPAKRSDVRLIQSFLAELRGSYGTFLYGDPDCLQQGVMGAGGTIVVDGDSQTGNTLALKGMSASTAGVLIEGDYFQLGTGLNARLYMVTQSLDSDASGNGTVTFEPALRTSPLDGESLIISAPKTLMRAVDNFGEWSSGAAAIYDGITLAFREVL